MTQAFWAPEYDVTADEARELIASQFPALQPHSVEPFGSGMDNLAYLVNATYVFRFPRRAIVVPLLETEARALPLIAGHLPTAISVPRFVGEPQGTYPWIFAGYGMIAGIPACTAALSGEQRAGLAASLGTFLRALHAIDPAVAVTYLPRDNIGRFDHEKRMPLSEERFSQLEATGYMSDAAPFLDFLRRHPPGELEPSAIVHGDLYARHILVGDNGQLSGIIDWGDVHFGHPAADLMAAHTMLPATAHQTFIDAYGGVDDRTWTLAKYRAIYHCALVADYGLNIGDRVLRDAGLDGLEPIRLTL